MDSYMVCYDISDSRRLRKVATACEDFGLRKQYSVFLCRITRTQFERLRARLYEIINHQEDQVLFLPVCGKCVVKMEAMGRPMEAVEARDVVVVV